jgi:hypothetical protein
MAAQAALEGPVPQDVVLKVPETDLEFVRLLESKPDLNATRLPGAGIDGGGEYLVFLIPLSHFAVKALVELLKAHWEKAANVKVEMEGMTFSGASLSEVSAFLEKHQPQHDSE